MEMMQQAVREAMQGFAGLLDVEGRGSRRGTACHTLRHSFPPTQCRGL